MIDIVTGLTTPCQMRQTECSASFSTDELLGLIEMRRRRLQPAVIAASLAHSDSDSDEDDDEIFAGEDDSDELDNVEEDDEDEDELLVEEGEDTESEEDESVPENDTYVARSGMVWQASEPQYTRRRGHNIMNITPGPTDISKAAMTIKDHFLFFFPTEILELICRETNNYAHAATDTDDTSWTDLTIHELCAYMGILLAAGRLQGRKLHVSQMWRQNAAFQYPLFSATMSRNRFCEISAKLRFDDPATRPTRLSRSEDKLEAIRTVVDAFTEKCIKSYNPHEILTVDERLALFHGKYLFRIYMKSKPGRYGIKIWICADSQNAYVSNLQVYTGMRANRKEANQGQRVVMDLVKPYLGSGRGLTTDNFFTSLPLAQSLLKSNITITGTLRANKADIPSEFLPSKNRQPNTCLFGFTKDETLLSYVPKPNKCVILLSTQHHGADIASSGKPEIIEHYNATKGGVDTGDAMTRHYSCVRQTRRWPMRIFMELLDIAALNAFILWRAKHPTWKDSCRSRRATFLEELSIELVLPNVQCRVTHTSGLHKATIDAMRMMGCGPPIRPALPTRQQQPRRCQRCPRAADRKTKVTCSTCGTPVCKDHRKDESVSMCLTCISDN